MNASGTTIQDQEYFTVAVQNTLSVAQQKAVSMNGAEVLPEHLFLGVLAQDADGITEAFDALRLNQVLLREQEVTLFPSHTAAKGEENDLPLSTEAQVCIEWAISFATYHRATNVQPEHILLACVRHQRLQPLLALLLMNAGSTLPFSLFERSGRAYTASMDQYISSRIRQQRETPISHSILSSFERPTGLFSDIAGFHSTKQELREAITFLRHPQLIQQDMRRYLYGLLFVGSAGTSRTSLVHAIAGEAGVPLLSLSFAALVETTLPSRSDYGKDFDAVGSPHSLSTKEQERAAVYGRQMLHDLFVQGKGMSPCVVYLDELDVFARPGMLDVCSRWQSQLCSELDACDTYLAVVATSRSSQHIDSSLVVTGRFAHIATLDGTHLRPFELGLGLCSACQQEVLADWKYCGFCGTAIARTCSQCDAIVPDIKGVHFCTSCGAKQGEK